MRGNAVILSGIAQPVIHIQAVCVKFIFIKKLLEGHDDLGDAIAKMQSNEPADPAAIADDAKGPEQILKEFDLDMIDTCSFVATFKIYQNTTFDDIKLAACEYWRCKNQEKMILTDEYFNNLAVYKDTVQNFFSAQAAYQPLNPDVEAAVFLVIKNTDRTTLHSLQHESCELRDDNNKKDGNETQVPEGVEDEDDADPSGDPAAKNKARRINMNKIAGTIVGLKTYEATIDEAKLLKYLAWSEGH